MEFQEQEPHDKRPIFHSHPSPEHDLDSLDAALSDSGLRHAVLPNRRVSRVASALVLPPLLSLKRNHRIMDKAETASTSTLGAPLVPWSKSREAKASLLSLISALYGLIIVIMAFSLEVSAFINEESSTSQYDAFYVYQYVVGLLFLIYCYMFLLRDKGWKIPLPFYKRNVSIKNLKKFTTTEHAQWTMIGNKTKKNKVSYASNSNTGSMYLRLGATCKRIIIRGCCS